MLSLDVKEDILAIGCDNLIILYSLKLMKSVSFCDFAHSNLVTNVRFKSNSTEKISQQKDVNGHYLLSGGEDGIINLFTVEQGLGEDSVVNTVNPNQSLSNIGFLDENMKFIDFTTCVQTYCVYSFDNYLPYFEFDAKSVRNTYKIKEVFNTDYIIDRYYDASKQIVELYCGN